MDGFWISDFFRTNMIYSLHREVSLLSSTSTIYAQFSLVHLNRIIYVSQYLFGVEQQN